MNKGFEIKCNNCGKVRDIKRKVKVYEWTIDVKCDCGNELLNWYQEEKYMKGFKVKCLQCGNETIYTQGGSHMAKDNDEVDVLPSGYDGQITIICECGNEIEDEY